MRGFKVSLCALLISSLWASDTRVDAWVRSLTKDKASQLAAGYRLEPRSQADEKVLIQELRPYLQDQHPEVRAYTASFFGEHRAADKDSLAGLISLLSDQSLSVREHAAVALAQIGPPAVPLLLRQLNLKEKDCARVTDTALNPHDCRDYAYAALYEIGWAALPQMFAMFRTLDSSGEGYTAALLRTLSPERPQTYVSNLLKQNFSALEMRSLLTSESLPLAAPLLDTFHGSDARQRTSSAFALYLLYRYSVPSPRRSESTTFPAPDPSKYVPTAPSADPAHARLVEPKTATSFLTVAILDSRNPLTDRQQMALFLRDLSRAGDRNTIGTALARIASNTSESWSMRTASASALDEAGLLEFIKVDTIRLILEDNSPWPLKTVAAGIAGRKGAAAEALASDLRRLATAKNADTMALASARALGHLGEPGLNSLAELLHSSDEHVQTLAAFGIAESGPKGAALRQEALASRSVRVRFAAQKGVPPPVLLAEASLPTYRAFAARKRVQRTTQTSQSIEELAGILAGHTQADVVEAANQLAMRGPQGVTVLSRYVHGQNPFISSAAIAALSRAGKSAAPAVPALCRALLDDRLQSGAARTLWIVGGYKADCGNSVTTVLKDGLIHEYISADLSEKLSVAPWAPPNPEETPEVPADRAKTDSLLRDLARDLAYPSPPVAFSSPDIVAQAILPALSMPNPSIWTTIHLPLAGSNNVYDAYSRILDALKNYPDIGLFAARGGFTLVTRVEQIDPNWRPIAGDYRWRSDRPSVSPLSPFNYFREMLFAPPGEFRMIAFMVTSDLKPEFGGEEWDEAQARSKFNEGAKILPEVFRKIPYAGHYCHVLIYNYSKPLAQIAKLQEPSDGVGDVELQLTNAGIWDKLR